MKRWLKSRRVERQLEQHRPVGFGAPPMNSAEWLVDRRSLLAGSGVLATSTVAVLAKDAFMSVEQGAAVGEGQGDPHADGQSGAGRTLPVSDIPFDSAVGKVAYVGETNMTSYLQERINAAAEENDVVRLRPGTYVCEGLTVPAKTAVDGWGGDGARFGIGAAEFHEYGAIQLRRPALSKGNAPIVSLNGSGAMVRGLTIDGADGPGTGLWSDAFEANIVGVRVIRSKGVGIDIAKANNGVMRDVWVDNCGTSSAPAVVIHSVYGTGSAGNTNNQDFYNLHIERAADVALRIGEPGVDALQVQWLRFYGLHVESPDDWVENPGNTSPLVEIYNVQGIDFISPMIYGGPGYLVSHDQASLLGPDAGGVRIIGGSLLGQEEGASSGGLIRLVRGGSFFLSGTALSRYKDHAVVVEAGYGEQVALNPSRSEGEASLVRDSRPSAQPAVIHGDLLVRGRVSSLAGLPDTKVRSGAEMMSKSGDDTAGVISLRVDEVREGEPQFELLFSEAYERPPVVSLTPMNAITARCLPYVEVSELGFDLYFSSPPASRSVAKFSYSVR